MTAAPQSTPVAEVKETTASSIVPALRNAFAAALVAFGLCFPIISYHAESNINNELILIGRWPLSFGISVLVFLFVLFRQISPPDWRVWFDRVGAVAGAAWAARWRNRRPKRRRGSRRRLAPATRSRVFRAVRARGRVLFPFIMLGLLGSNGSLKWINNYGIQIMIYVMLGWGLNIVVGLAGLLDLGYVAFYAVGAYSYALLSTSFLLSFWVCLPLAASSPRCGA